MKITISKIHLINDHKAYDVLINGSIEKFVNIAEVPSDLKEGDVIEVNNVTKWGSCNLVKTFKFISKESK